MTGFEFGDGSGASATELSARFYAHFQRVRNDISQRLESLDLSPSGDAVAALAGDIAQLRKDLVDVTPYLPSYDRGKCEQQLKVLEESLSLKRAPKTKFAFRRTPGPTSSASRQAISKPPPPPPPPPPSPPPQPPSSSSPTASLTISSQSSTRISLSSLSLSPSSPADASSAQTGPRSSDITLTDLNECIIDFFPPAPPQAQRVDFKITALHARSLRRVVLLVPPIEGSVLLHDIRDSIVVVACHQFRMHDSSNTIVPLHVLSTPIIEGSRGIQFGAYPAPLRELISASFQDFFARPSQHASPQDFDWIKSSPSPNWSLIQPSGLDDNKLRRAMEVTSGGESDDSAERVPRFLDEILPRG